MDNIPDVFMRIFVGFYNSYFFTAVKLILAIYVTVLFADIVMILMIRGLGPYYRTGIKGMDIPAISTKRMKKRWEKISNRLKTDNVSQYKVAIIEADAIIDEILKGIGYKGENMTERIEKILPGHVHDVEQLGWAHDIRNQIIHDEAFEVDRKKAGEVLEVYRKILEDFEYL